MSNVTKRILVGIIGAPIIVATIILGGWWFFAFVQVIALMGLSEFYQMAENKARGNRVAGYTAGIAAGFILQFTGDLYGLAAHEGARLFLLISILLLFTIVVLSMELWRARPNAIVNVSVTVFGVLYVSLGMESLIGLRTLFEAPWLRFDAGGGDPTTFPDTYGMWLVLNMLGAIWTCDTAAYFIGSKFGRHKLFERISPKKSWEGALSGFVGSIVFFTVMSYIFLPVLPVWHAIIVGGLIGAAGQLGDLAESLLKRDAGVKDSSNLIPGHGGILDRSDSVLFVAPLVYIYVCLFLLFTSV